MIDKNDHRLTAYALGELAEADFPKTEAEICSSDELLAEVEAIRKIAEEVSEIFQAENSLSTPMPVLALGFAPEQPLHDATLACPASGISKQLEYKTSSMKRTNLGYYVVRVSAVVVIVCLIGTAIIIQNISNNKVASNASGVKAVNPASGKEENGIVVAKSDPNSDETISDSYEIETGTPSTESVPHVALESNTLSTDAISAITNDNNNDINGLLLSNNISPKESPALDTPEGVRNARSLEQAQNLNTSLLAGNIAKDNNSNNSQRFVAATNSYNQYLTQNQKTLAEQSYQPNENIETFTAGTSSSGKSESNVLPENMREDSDSNVAAKKEQKPPDSNISNRRTTIVKNSAQAVSKSSKLDTKEQQREAVVLGRSLPTISDSDSAAAISAYELMSRSINDGKLPPSNAIKIGDYVNNFRYNNSLESDQRFVIQTDLIQCPWNAKHLLARVWIKKSADKKTTDKNSDDAVSAKNELTDAEIISEQMDKQVKVAVKFSKNKISGYLPIDKIGVEVLSQNHEAELNTNEKSNSNKDKADNSTMTELCDVDAAIGSKGEVTLLYEVVPSVQAIEQPRSLSPSNLTMPQTPIANPQSKPKPVNVNESSLENHFSSNDYFSVELSNAEMSSGKSNEPTGETQFAAAVALYGLLLQKDGVMENCNWDTVKSLATPNTKNNDQRKEFLKLIEKASKLTPNSR
ncbi:MAG: von Willebrand factor type A domain-containing protein [Planctomycetaceae bacterium]|nr:von Willebrand factor type A domain-containing protein [Planctomycetaceae bacterium]